jgi:hypothetical protein
MNNKTMFIRMENHKVEYAYELPEDYDYEIVECDDDSYESIIKKIGKIKDKIIKIIVAYGQVKYIFNLPEDYDYEVITGGNNGLER